MAFPAFTLIFLAKFVPPSDLDKNIFETVVKAPPLPKKIELLAEISPPLPIHNSPAFNSVLPVYVFAPVKRIFEF